MPIKAVRSGGFGLGVIDAMMIKYIDKMNGALGRKGPLLDKIHALRAGLLM